MRKLLYILPLFLGFILTGGPPWQQQYMPNINGASVRDIIFTDSLNGYAVTNIGGSNSYILKTSDGGDNWVIKFMHTQPFVRVSFINSSTGFTNAFNKIFKTTNAGENWNVINLPSIFGDDMFVLSEDTIWLAMSESLTGGVYRTTNGGMNWTQQFSGGNQNPNKIYMYNGQFGFMSNNSALPNIYRTMNGGLNWSVVLNGENFTDIHFIDSLTGWKCTNSSSQAGKIKKSTDGGLNWTMQNLPPEIPPFTISRMFKFSFISPDTIWGIGGVYTFSGGQSRGVIWKTTNGGLNWGYQIPDTSINIYIYNSIQFTNANIGWGYSPLQGGVHTTIGGGIILPVEQISSHILGNFKLYQNYPNPFNPEAKIKYELKSHSYVKLMVYDISGRLAANLVNELQQPGTYLTSFHGELMPSGAYFYRLVCDGVTIDTKKMVLIK